MSQQNAQYTSSHFAVIDLGSNSFHLLITEQVNKQFKVVAKVKEKVRLAAGLDNKNQLSNDAIRRALDCIVLFSQHLSNIPHQNIRIVATAALRLATNRDDFLVPANKILPVDISLLSGEQEANTIYSGVAHTCHSNLNNKRFVIDIGGASTELIIGQGFNAKHALSLNLGCVSFKEKYFANNLLTEVNFSAATSAASKIIMPTAKDFICLGWESVSGSSGTMQALAEVLQEQNRPIVITLNFLQEIKQSLIQCKTIDNITLPGLRSDRTPVLASGLSILIALFKVFKITELTLSRGALREGLLHEMLPSQSV